MPQDQSPLIKNKSDINRRRLLLMILGIVCTLCLFALAQLLSRTWFENQLDALGVEYDQLSLGLLHGEVVLTDVSWGDAKRKIQTSTIHVDLKPSMLWTHSLEGAHIAIGKTSVRVSQRILSHAVTRPAIRQSHISRLNTDRLVGLSLSWSEVTVRIEHDRAQCKVYVPPGAMTLMKANAVKTWQQVDLNCRVLGHVIQTALSVDVSALPTSVKLRQTAPIKVPTLSANLDFETADLQVLPKLRLAVEQVRLVTHRFELKMSEIELWRHKGDIHALAHGGLMEYVRGQQSKPSTNGAQTTPLPRGGYPLFHLDWFGTELRLDGQQVGHIRHLEVKPNSASVNLIRGDSSIFVALMGIRRGLNASTLTVAGHLELADIDMLWPSSAMIDGAVGIDAHYTFESGDAVLALQSEKVRVLHPSLSMMPFHLPRTQTRLFGSYRIGDRGGSMTGTFKMGALSTRLAAAIGEEGDQFDFRWTSDEVPCNVLTTVLPIEWVEQLNVKFRGTAQPRITLVGKQTQLAELRFRLRGIVERCRVDSVALPWAQAGIYLVKDGQRTPVAPSSEVDVLNARFTKIVDPTYTDGARVKVGPGTPRYTSLSSLPAYVPAIMFLSEEVDFYKNLAVDLGLIQRALGLDLSHGRYVYGGSTITQQLVKNLILDRRKTLRRKFHEMLIADRVYQRVPKSRVLELYINVIEFGPRVFGIEAAASFYFQKTAGALSISESIFLAMLKPDPSRGVAYVRRGRTPSHEYWFTRSEQLLGRLSEYGYISAEEAQGVPPLELFWSEGSSVHIPAEK